MPEHLTERELLGELRRIRRGGPPLRQSDAAIARAVASLRPRRRVTHPLLTAAGLAAALALAAVLWALWPNGTGSQASAATLWAELQATTQATKSFRGWYTRLDEAGRPFRYVNTIDGSNVEVYRRNEDGRPVDWIEFLDVGARQIRSWVPGEKTIFVQQLSPITDFAKLRADARREIDTSAQVSDFEETYRQMSKTGVKGAGKIEKEMEGETARYIIEDKYRRVVYEADARTGLLTRGVWTNKPEPQRNIKGGTTTWHYRYNDPVVTSLHDVGVPEDAKVVDLRASPEAAALREMYQRWLELPAGDGAAVVTQVPTHAALGSSGYNAPQLHLLMRRDGRWASWTWRVDVPVAGEGELVPGLEDRTWTKPGSDEPQHYRWRFDERQEPVTIPPPPGWPTPSVEQAIEHVRGRLPLRVAVARDGAETYEQNRRWIGQWGSVPALYDISPEVTQRSPFFAFPLDWMIGSETQFGLFGYGKFSYAVPVDGPGAPEGVQPEGIEVRGRINPPGALPADLDPPRRPDEPLERFWLDAGRAGMPLKYAEGFSDAVPGEPRRVVFDRPIRWGQKWYPSRWRVMTERIPELREVPEYPVAATSHLAVDETIRPGEEWFTPPPAKPWPPEREAATRPASGPTSRGADRPAE